METLPEQVLGNVDSLLSRCDHILETELSDQELVRLQAELNHLKTQSASYLQELADKKANACSEHSRIIAALILTEEQNLEEFMTTQFPQGSRTDRESLSDQELNIGALYVEYMTDRARQSLREALIGACQLKLLDKERILS